MSLSDHLDSEEGSDYSDSNNRIIRSNEAINRDGILQMITDRHLQMKNQREKTRTCLKLHDPKDHLLRISKTQAKTSPMNLAQLVN